MNIGERQQATIIGVIERNYRFVLPWDVEFGRILRGIFASSNNWIILSPITLEEQQSVPQKWVHNLRKSSGNKLTPAAWLQYGQGASFIDADSGESGEYFNVTIPVIQRHYHRFF